MNICAFGLFATLLLCSPALLALDRVLSQDTVAFAISKNGRSWAHISIRPFVLEVRSRQGRLRATMNELDGVSEVSPRPSIEWSPDSRYLLIVYQNEEAAASAEVYDAKNLKRVFFYPVSDARWLKSGATLIVVPASNELGSHASRGLLVVNVRSQGFRRIANKHTFVGRLDAGDSYVVAQALKQGNGGTTEFVRVNAYTGKVDE